MTEKTYVSKSSVAKTKLSDYLPPGLIETRETDVVRPSDAPINPVEFQNWMTQQIKGSTKKF